MMHLIILKLKFLKFYENYLKNIKIKYFKANFAKFMCLTLKH